jgi:hypothetical protein
MIGEEHLLILDVSRLFLSKINYKSWKISVVANYRNMNEAILLDSLNHRKLIIYNWIGFISDILTGDRITFGPQKELSYLSSIVSAFLRLIVKMMLEFGCKVDLDTLREQAIDLPMILDDKSLISNIDVSFYIRHF